ncbi:unnamed protein product [Haemonchus placei]|uniref:PHD-type domain-containing protein n=1 Tax=Haemonchus placei TaxID=6290 RepID=A0A3P7X4X1_HAEPC|nr:unnamed protein product [Haemonchus placei]
MVLPTADDEEDDEDFIGKEKLEFERDFKFQICNMNIFLRCGLTVHDSCYPSLDMSDDSESSQSSSSMEPWFCEPCIYGFNEPPYCELCPSRYGAMKRSDVGGRWVHLLCALYTHGVTFGDIDHLGAISWQEMDHRNFGRKSCSGCTDVLEARLGVTTRCELGLCKQYYHVTCAQRLGLLVDHSEDVDHFGVEPRYINCRQHSNPDDVRVKKQASVSQERKVRRARHLTTSPEFFEWFQEKAEISGVEPEHLTFFFFRNSRESLATQFHFLLPAFRPSSSSDDQHLMIACDSCYEYYHIGCLDPPLEKVPKKVNCEWHCADCCDNSSEDEENENNEVIRVRIGFTTFNCITRKLHFTQLYSFRVLYYNYLNCNSRMIQMMASLTVDYGSEGTASERNV